MTATPAHAAPVSDTQGGMTFTADDTNVSAGATVVSYDSGVGGLTPTVPATVTIGANTYAVTAIGDNAFKNESITSVTLNDAIITIGVSAFQNNSLTALTLPANIAAISDQAFNNNSLASVDLPDTVITIGERAFQNNNLVSLTLPNGVTTIGDRAFFGNQLSIVVFPATVTSIGVRAFKEAAAMTDVVFLGAAPATFAALGSGNALGDSPGPLVHYSSAFAAPGAPSGYTTPTWMDYNAIPNPILTFDMAGHGAAISPMDVGFTLPATAPSAPSEANWAFTGWFADAARTTPFDFAAPVAADATVFAGWRVVPALAKTGVSAPILLFALLAALLVAAGVVARTRATLARR